MNVRVPLIIVLALAFNSLTIESRSIQTISGRTIDFYSGKPVSNVTIILLNSENLRKYQGVSDRNGDFEIPVEPGDYYIYSYYDSPSTPGFDSPLIRSKTIYKAGLGNITIPVIPGGSIVLEGVLWDVEAGFPDYYAFTVNTSIDLGEFYTVKTFGNPPYKYKRGDEIRYIEFDRKTVLVPCRNVELRADLLYLNISVGSFFTSFEIEIRGESGGSFSVNQGERLMINLEPLMISWNIKRAEDSISKTRSLISSMENAGFYLAVEKERLNEAERLLSKIAVSTNLSFLQHKEPIYEAYHIASWEIPRRIELMRIKARSSALALPVYVSLFSVLFSYFIYEEERKKLVQAYILSSISMSILLYFFFPGTRFIVPHLYIISLLLSMAVTYYLLFRLPNRLAREFKVEGLVSFKDLITVFSSLAIRNLKRRKIRAFFTILSIAILAAAFTDMTSFSVVYGVKTENLNIQYLDDMAYLVVPSQTFDSTPIPLEETNWLRGYYKTAEFHVKMETFPTYPAEQVEIKYNGRTAGIYGVIGLSNKIAEILFSSKSEIEDWVIISKKLSKSMGIEVGDTIQVYAREPGGAIWALNLTVRLVVSDTELKSVVDPDGTLFLPIKDPNSGERCKPEETIIVSTQSCTALIESVPLKTSGIYVFSNYETLSKISYKLASMRMYNVYLHHDETVKLYYIGEKLEIRGLGPLLIPMLIVISNVAAVTLNTVYERMNEARLLSNLGLNPRYISTIFIMESIMTSMIGGFLGYFVGLIIYRGMVAFSSTILVREKVEWYWPIIAVFLSLVVSTIASAKFAVTASLKIVPSRMRKKVKTDVRAKFKAYGVRTYSMPVRVPLVDEEFFLGFVESELSSYRGYTQSVSEIERKKYAEDNKTKITLSYKYKRIYGARHHEVVVKLHLTKYPDRDYYLITAEASPVIPGAPERALDDAISFLRDILMSWCKRGKP